MTGPLIDSAELRRRINRHLSHHDKAFYDAQARGDREGAYRASSRKQAVMDVLADVRAMMEGK